MDNSSIYESIMMNGCFNRLKDIRNSWNDKKSSVYGVEQIMDVGGEEFRNYDYIMNQCNLVIVEMIPLLIVELMKNYEIPAQFYGIKQNDAHIFSNVDGERWPDYIEQSNRKILFALSCREEDREGLYVFKEFGLGNRIPESLLEKIKSEIGVKRHCYVSMVEKDAYLEVINHNDDENDPSRGTGVYSLKDFFDFFFGYEEYKQFKRYADKLSEMVKNYYGFEIVRTLRPNTLYNFRKNVREDILSLNIKDFDSNRIISEEQGLLMEKHFFEEKNYELLTGASDFAQSYMTAEWLFSSLGKAGNIDLTVIAMGYFKAIEQLLFRFIKLHVKENDTTTRYIFVGKGKAYADDKGYAELTQSIMNDENKTKDINLGSLTGFFGYFDERRSRYYDRNEDLLCTGINKQTYRFIIDTLGKIVGLRNGYFHKDNLNDWEMVLEARKTARIVFFLILGAYDISSNDRNELGMINAVENDEFSKLCDYLNNKKMNSMFEIPVFYMNENAKPEDFWYSCRDEYIEYDMYGYPMYSGVYFRRFNEKTFSYKATKDDISLEIWEGNIVISKKNPGEIKLSGPMKKIYKDGEFFV